MLECHEMVEVERKLGHAETTVPERESAGPSADPQASYILEDFLPFFFFATYFTSYS